MTRPGGPQQQGWQHPGTHPQPYPGQSGWQPHPHPQQWGPPPRKKKSGVLVGVLVTLLVVGLVGGGFWVYEQLDDPPAPPPVDASRDLDEAPIGCAMLAEEDVAPYIPGRMDYGPGSANPGPGQLQDQGQCNWSNTGTFTEDGVAGAFVIVTSYVFHADRELSGVAKAEEHMAERLRPGVAVDVPDAEDAQLFQAEDDDSSATVTVRYRNVVYDVNYRNLTEGANVKAGATALATVAIGVVVPD